MTLRLGPSDDHVSLVGKTYTNSRATRVHDVMRRLTSRPVQGLLLPHPVAVLPELDLHLQTELRGVLLRQHLEQGRIADLPALARSLARLHGSHVSLPRTRTLHDELDPLTQRVARLQLAAPALEDDAGRCLRQLLADVPESLPWRDRVLHRDIYHDNALVDGAEVALVDLDDAAMGEPAIDVANVLAHLRLLALQVPSVQHRLDRGRTMFIAAYRRHDAALEPDLVSFLEAATLLRLATIHYRDGRSQPLAKRLLEHAQKLLGS
jgi:Ser/Thr protein kinase RdoA (MazF antagonist)